MRTFTLTAVQRAGITAKIDWLVSGPEPTEGEVVHLVEYPAPPEPPECGALHPEGKAPGPCTLVRGHGCEYHRHGDGPRWFDEPQDTEATKAVLDCLVQRGIVSVRNGLYALEPQGTSTGRVACSEPNLSNVERPSDPGVDGTPRHRILIPSSDEGWFRLYRDDAVHLGMDPEAINAALNERLSDGHPTSRMNAMRAIRDEFKASL